MYFDSWAPANLKNRVWNRINATTICNIQLAIDCVRESSMMLVGCLMMAIRYASKTAARTNRPTSTARLAIIGFSFRTRAKRRRHQGGRANMVMMDGHVETFTAEELTIKSGHWYWGTPNIQTIVQEYCGCGAE
jgi:prepilin-type processing-associated H-X9-DG protein